MKNLNLSKKIISIVTIIAIAMVAVPFTRVNAAENNMEIRPEGAVEVKPSDESYDEGLKVFNLSREEVEEKGLKLYKLGAGRLNFQTVTFTGSFGGVYWRNSGTMLRWGYSWNGEGGNSNNLYIRVGLYKYPCNDSDLISESIRNNGESFSSGWVSVHTGMDYRFKYNSYYSGGALGTVSVTSWVVMN